MSHFQDLGLALYSAVGKGRLNFAFLLFRWALQPMNGGTRVQWSMDRFAVHACCFLLTSRVVIQPIRTLCAQR